MPRRLSVPSYRLHKQSGQAIVTLTDGLGGRHDKLLGKYNSAESRLEYARVIAEWEAAGRCLPKPEVRAADLSVNELILAYWRFAEGYYVKNGQPTSQLERVRLSLQPVKELYGHTPARNFGPLALKAVREQMVKAGWVRRYINQCIGCVRRMFRWAVGNELVPPSVFHGLQAVDGLKKGRCNSPESKPILPVKDEVVDATLPFLTRPVRAMVQVQRLGGMRPGEVVIMRPCDIDRSGHVWTYRPESHKTEHHGRERLVFLGPKAQEVLQPFLFRDPETYLFSPREAIAEFRALQRQRRKTKVQPSQQNRRKRKPKKLPRERYWVDSYDQAIASACLKAGVPHWSPNQLRHAQGTEVRKLYGLEGAQVTLGHASAQVTQVYAERDQALAMKIAAEIG